MISSEDAFMHISFAEFGFGFLPSITYGKLVDSLFYSTLSLKRGYIVFFFFLNQFFLMHEFCFHISCSQPAPDVVGEYSKVTDIV